MYHLIVDFSQNARNIFQNLYDSVVNLFGGNNLYLDVFGTLIISLSVYWGVGALFTLLDLTRRPKFLYKYKIQDTKVTFAQILPVMKQVFFNQTVVAAPFLLSIYYYKRLTGYKTSPEIPTFFTVIKDWIGFLILQEVSFYYTHRLFHIPKIYKYIHKKHHEWKAPIAIAAMYAHPLEHLVSNLLSQFLEHALNSFQFSLEFWLGVKLFNIVEPKTFIIALVTFRAHVIVYLYFYSLGPALLPSHRFTNWVWLIYNQWETLNGHSGYHFPLIPSPEYHDYHHLMASGNYGVIGFFDWLHGTDQEFKKSKFFPRHRIFFGLDPVKNTYPDSNNSKNVDKKSKKI